MPGATTPLPATPARDPARRATLAAPSAAAEGIGLNTGRRARLVLHPASAGSGIRFRWRASPAAPTLEVAALAARACAAPFCTALTLGSDAPLLRTPEHLLAALSACGVDDALVEIEGAPEVPILDGSALPWCRLIAAAGIAEQGERRRILALRRPVELVQEGRFIRAEPATELAFDVSLDLAGWGALRWSGTPTGEGFVSDLTPARSFGRLRWALPLALLARLSRRPVLRGARLSNTAPLVGGTILGGARLPDEPVRHRALDLLGDLALLGMPLHAHVTARRPSHALNQAFVQHLLAQADAVETRDAGA
ncbi:MAG TPA: UDP-3-O-acyl-N-acetylglucosamine deacetylase [Acetobacteraceae bacterium]|nr:UDP-3-O-acyl-N-acetylglucosamine deacetylase [Acetobacteraceae bacterium]